MTDYASKTMPLHDDVKKEWNTMLNTAFSEDEKAEKEVWCELHDCEIYEEEEGVYRIKLKEGCQTYPKQHSAEYAEWANWANSNGYVLIKEDGMYIAQKVGEHRYILKNEDGSVTTMPFKGNENYVLDDDSELVESWNGKTYLAGEEPSEEGFDWALTRINELELKLKSEDYKIIKCAEAKLLDEEMPYDAESLIKERNKYRDEINALQKEYSIVD